jgi:hypothetical protein
MKRLITRPWPDGRDHTERFQCYASSDCLTTSSTEQHSHPQSQIDALMLDARNRDKNKLSQGNYSIDPSLVLTLSLPSHPSQTGPSASSGSNRSAAKPQRVLRAEELPSETLLLPGLSWMKQTALVPIIRARSWRWRLFLGLALLTVVLSGIGAGIFTVMILAPYPIYCLVIILVLIVLCSHLFSLVIKRFCRGRIIRPLRSSILDQYTSPSQHQTQTDEKSHFQLIREDTNLYLSALHRQEVEQGVDV